MIKASLKDKDGYDEYCEEYDAATPPKKASKIRCSKKEMEEKLPLVGHGLVELHSFTLFFLTCIVFAGVTTSRS